MKKEGVQCEKVADSFIWPTRLSSTLVIIIEHFIKYGKFIPTNKSHSVKDLTDIVIQKVINNHRLLNEFITNKDTTFVSHFFITFIIKLRINNKLSIAFYP